MKQYTRDQLDSKINAFLSRKFTQYPELRQYDISDEQLKRNKTKRLQQVSQTIWTYVPA